MKRGVNLYKHRLGWTDGLGALVFHGQRADVAAIFNLTNVFEVADVYEETAFATGKLMLGFVIGGFTKYLAIYGEGHYLLTEKGGTRQLSELGHRGLKAEEVWVLDASDPRRNLDDRRSQP